LLRDLRYILPVVGCATVLSACQPQLNSGLPLGAAAYETLGGVNPQVEGVYRIRPGDTVNVTLFQEPDLSGTSLLVDEGGAVSLPLIGAVQMAGRTTEEVAREIERAYAARYLRDPQASVSLRTAVPQTVTVDGQVTRAGVYEMRPGYTLVSAIALAGGTTDTSKFDEVLILRMIDGRRAVARFDINAIRAGRMDDPRILPGDQVVVGFDRARGIYQDVLRVGPILGVFTQL
jgi:polysaccharide biosynthesis/export protein